MKITGITYFNFEDKATKRVNKGVNVHGSKNVNENMGVGVQGDKVAYPVETFNAHFKLNLPTDDKAELPQALKPELEKLIGREINVLYNDRQKPEVTQFK